MKPSEIEVGRYYGNLYVIDAPGGIIEYCDTTEMHPRLRTCTPRKFIKIVKADHEVKEPEVK